jgi:hypothetical protein
LMRLNYIRERKEKEVGFINPDFQAIYSNI